MEWVNSSSIHEVCELLGYTSAVTGEYCVKGDTCEDALNNLLVKLNTDGPSLRMRRSLGISQVVSRDFMPLLKSASPTPKIMHKVVKLLANLTTPVELLVPTDFSSTGEGQQIVFELDILLQNVKIGFADIDATKAIADYMKHLTNTNESLFSPLECEGVSETLLLLRNILHIPQKKSQVQNQILWNLFSHQFDKILLQLMTCEQKNIWVITLVQIIALIYKDQHMSNLQKLLNLWLENSMSESSEDNESNTSPPGGEGSSFSSSSPMLTSDPDSSDNGGHIRKQYINGNCFTGTSTSTLNTNDNIIASKNNKNNSNNCNNLLTFIKTEPGSTCNFRPPHPHEINNTPATASKVHPNKEKALAKERTSDADSGVSSMIFAPHTSNSSQTPPNTDENSENGMNPLSITIKEEHVCQQGCHSASSNEDSSQDWLQPKGGKQRGRAAKQSNHEKLVQKLRRLPTITSQDKLEMKRKKLHKRSKRNRKNAKAFTHHHNPTEEDISHILKEFTVDFLLKGYGSLVANLQEQISVNSSIPMDKSHFLWLITYFLRFASQLELDLEHISPVLSCKMLSYLTFEGAAMCENLALCKGDVKPHLRRMHLVVTAIREFIQAVEIYSKISSYCAEDKNNLNKLQNDILNTEEFRNLFLMLIREFRPGVQSKQYLQDLIITNHLLLLFLEKVSTSSEYKGSFQMIDFIKEFSFPSIMQQYGHLLEDFEKNGEFVNDCVFTMMHHIAGDLKCPEALFQPLILKTFSSIWEVEFEIRDDWADLIEYVIQRFMKANEEKQNCFKPGTSNASDDIGWTKGDIERLYWLYSSCSSCKDPITKIVEAYGEKSTGKTKESVLNQLLHQRIIGYNQFLLFLATARVKTEDIIDGNSNPSSIVNSGIFPSATLVYHSIVKSAGKTGNVIGSSVENTSLSTMPNRFTLSPILMEMLEKVDVSVADIVSQVAKEGHEIFWLQKQVLDACFVKWNLEQSFDNKMEVDPYTDQKRFIQTKNVVIIEPIPYHYNLLGQSIPIIPWTHSQEILLRSPSFSLLLHKLGFQLPGNIGKRFPRIPSYWTADVLYSVAKKLGPIPAKEKLKFNPKNLVKMAEKDVKDMKKITGLSNTFPNQENPSNNFMQAHTSYSYPAVAAPVNWMTLVHKSKQLIQRQSESTLTSSPLQKSLAVSNNEPEHMDDCASLKALPPTEHSESGQEDNDEGVGKVDDESL